MNAPAMPLAEVTVRAMRLLTDTLGPADTARFLNQFGTGTGDYTAERDALVGHLTLDEVVALSRQHDASREG